MPFDVQIDPSFTLLPLAERTALNACQRACSSYPEPMPAFTDGACTPSSCCGCLRDVAGEHDPVAYCSAQAKKIVVPYFSGATVAKDGKKIAAIRVQYAYENATCSTMFAAVPATPAEVLLLAYDPSVTPPQNPVTSTSLLATLPADTVETTFSPPLFLADDSQLGFYVARGDGDERTSQLWVVNADGSRPRQLLPVNTTGAARQTALCGAAGTLDLVWFAIAALWLHRKRKRA